MAYFLVVSELDAGLPVVTSFEVWNEFLEAVRKATLDAEANKDKRLMAFQGVKLELGPVTKQLLVGTGAGFMALDLERPVEQPPEVAVEEPANG